MEMTVTRSNKGPNSNGVDPTAMDSQMDTSTATDDKGKTPVTPTPDPPPALPLLQEQEIIPNNPDKDPNRQQFEKALITQMNILTGSLNTMNAQFHVLQQEIIHMNGTLPEIKNQQFQQQIQENKEEIDHVTTRVSELEASVQFNDDERAAIKDHIKRIEQSQKQHATRIQQISEKQHPVNKSCNCSKRLDQIKLASRKKNIIIAGVSEHRDERLKYLALEILSNTNLPLTPHDIEQAVRVGTYKQRGPPSR